MKFLQMLASPWLALYIRIRYGSTPGLAYGFVTVMNWFIAIMEIVAVFGIYAAYSFISYIVR